MDNINLLKALEASEDQLVKALGEAQTHSEQKLKEYGLILETLAHVRGLAEAIQRRQTESPYDHPWAEAEPPKPEPKSKGKSKAEKMADTAVALSNKADALAAEQEAAPEAETFAPGGCDESESEPAPSIEEQKPITPAPKPAPQLTKQDMVTTLSYYAGDKGGNVDVFGIMQKHGWNNLSGVPKEEYRALLDEVKAAAGVE